MSNHTKAGLTLPINARPLGRTDIVAQYAALLTPQDIALIESHSRDALRCRPQYGLTDAAYAWAEGTIYLLLTKGLLRPLEAVRAELKPISTPKVEGG